MNMQGSAAFPAASRSRNQNSKAQSNKTFSRLCRAVSAAFLLQTSLFAASAEAGLYQSTPVPLQQFGFSTIGRVQSAQDYIKFFDNTQLVLGNGAIVRTGLGWDPIKQSAPGFTKWSADVLEPALARGITVLPGIRTLNLTTGGYRMPTDAQWETGVRWIVRMYGPNGLYQNGGSYVIDGRTVTVAPHPGFAGLTDFELWNEPNTQGNLNGAMTPTRITELLRIGSTAMRDEASKMGFSINIIGPAIGGINLEYLTQLWNADNNLFNYIDTLSIHAYTRFAPTQCDAFGTKKVRCVLSFAEIRWFMDHNGGAHVHLATTEGGISGDRGTCIGPQVRTEEQQSDYSEQNLNWIRARPNLKFDFWITPNPVDGTKTYSHPCNSGTFDIPYWEDKLGVIRADLTMKPWGIRYRDLVNSWRNPN